MAVTLFQSALQKLTVDQPLYDHLVHNLLLSYKLLIEQLLGSGDKTIALAMRRLMNSPEHPRLLTLRHARTPSDELRKTQRSYSRSSIARSC
jgi:hypothetical protein